MGIAIALVGMTSLAMAILLVPLLLRQRLGDTREAYNLTVYRDQLAEVERDIERGVLTAEQAGAARIEISRRMLALAPETAAPSRNSPVLLAIATVAVVMLPFAAWALYWHLGSPSVPDLPFAERGAPPATSVAANANTGAAPHIDMAQAVLQLTAHLKQQPDDLDSWLLLGRSNISLQHYPEAVAAYRRAVELSKQRPDVVGDYGEALMLAADGMVTPEAQAAFVTAMKDPESVPRSRYYLGLAKLQQGDAKGALQAWVDLESDAPADATWLPMLHQHIDQAATSAGIDPAGLKTTSGVGRRILATATPAAAPTSKTPTPTAPINPSAESDSGQPSAEALGEAAQAAAGASAEDRQAMINGMVAKLAAHLQDEPNDGDGWSRLGRSYVVLNQAAKARDAYAHAVKLKPEDIELKLAYADAIVEAAGGGAAGPPDEVTALMREVLQKEPDNREALWYVGIAEATAGHSEAAYDLWKKLLAQLPAASPERSAVEERIAALKLDGAK